MSRDLSSAMKVSASRPTNVIHGTASAVFALSTDPRRRRPWGCTDMIQIPVLRWGQPYESLDVDEVVHFSTGEPIARVSRANGGLIQRDMRKAHLARQALTRIPIAELIDRVGRAGRMYMEETLPMGDGTQTPDEFVRAQSASTGLPEHMCRANMKKNGFVLDQMRNILVSLTRGLDLDVLTRGYGEERDVPISFQAESPVLGLVLPSNSPGVHTLWLPIIPLQIGLVLKPGPQEPWTPFRMAEAFFEAGIPREAISVYPGAADVGAARPGKLRPQFDLWRHRDRGSISWQSTGPGARPRVFENTSGVTIRSTTGKATSISWPRAFSSTADAVASTVRGSGPAVTPGRSAEALAERLSAVRPLPPEDPEAGLAAFTVAGVADAVSQAIDTDLGQEGVSDVTARHRSESRVVSQGPCRFICCRPSCTANRRMLPLPGRNTCFPSRPSWSVRSPG